MKIKELNKKLVLNKATVVDLEKEDMNAVKGGIIKTMQPYECRSMISACCPW